MYTDGWSSSLSRAARGHHVGESRVSVGLHEPKRVGLKVGSPYRLLVTHEHHTTIILRIYILESFLSMWSRLLVCSFRSLGSW